MPALVTQAGRPMAGWPDFKSSAPSQQLCLLASTPTPHLHLLHPNGLWEKAVMYPSAATCVSKGLKCLH